MIINKTKKPKKTYVDGETRFRQKFFWFPTRLSDTKILWLEAAYVKEVATNIHYEASSWVSWTTTATIVGGEKYV